MTPRVLVAVGGLMVSAAAIGWACAEQSAAAGVAPAVAVVILWRVLVEELLDAPDPDRLAEAVDLLAEVLAEHGPIYCDPGCGCTACTAARWLQHHDPARFADASWWTRG